MFWLARDGHKNTGGLNQFYQITVYTKNSKTKNTFIVIIKFVSLYPFFT